MITKISNESYRTESKIEALVEAELLSKLENKVFSVVLIQNHSKKISVYYIDRGVSEIGEGEILIAKFDKGIKVWTNKGNFYDI